MRIVKTVILILMGAALLLACSHRSETPVSTSPNPVSRESPGPKSGYTESTGGDNGRDATGASSNPGDPYGKRPDTSQNPTRGQTPGKTPANESSQ